MTLPKPRLAPRIAEFPELIREANRSFGELASSVDGAFADLLLGGAVMLSVPLREAASTFSFIGLRRIYSSPSANDPPTFDIRVFNTGQTILRHPLGRPPLGRLVLGQQSTGDLIDLNVAALSPPLDPAAFVAFSSTTTAVYRIAVL